ncbi:12052_t:CDS:2 [Funneliformis geosporum]|uniref:13078_t:CDS:1 n=1 Tax=Funneliformis geosporum TaxID=1117311 RepID=A0A9W4WL53_9GLOM|nr:12052_t:CDS:2 [Funneliformis geosporum]CAI2169714.1 13078_t:CDS:2 [Funneliformis geosporum]
MVYEWKDRPRACGNNSSFYSIILPVQTRFYSSNSRELKGIDMCGNNLKDHQTIQSRKEIVDSN